jgi:predicted nucleic acid-binding protein
VVLDTNVVLSALVFAHGRLAPLRRLAANEVPASFRPASS